MDEGLQEQGRFPALYIRDFRIFWIGQVISFSGTWMQSTAQGWLVYSLTKSPMYLGIVATAASLPVLMLVLIGGVTADRFAKRNLLITTQSLSMIPAILLAVFTDLDIIAPWMIVIFAAILGTVNAFDVPARQSYLIEMVQKGRLMNAIALNSAAFNGARIIGPFMAGIAIAYIGVAACFYVNALSFLGAIFALTKIKARGASIKKGPAGSGFGLSKLVHELREGLGFVVKERHILIVMLLVAVFSLFGIPFVTLLPVFAEDILDVGPQGLGILGGASGIGAFTAAIYIAFKGEIRKKGHFMSYAAVIFSVFLCLFSLSKNYHASLFIVLFLSWGIVSFLAVGNSFTQLSTPDALRGRVMSVYALVFLGMAPIGNAFMGFLADRIGAANAVTAGSAICFAATLSAFKRLRAIDIH